MLSISCGMMMLASVLGYNRTSECIVDSDDVSTAKHVLYAESARLPSDLEEKNITTLPLYTGEGAERYRYFQNGNRAVVFDSQTKKVCYSGDSAPFNEYLTKEDGLPLYLPHCPKGQFAIASSKGVWTLNDHSCLNRMDLLASIDQSTLSSDKGKWEKVSNPNSVLMDHRAKNGFYLEKLGHYHGNNTKGTCGIVASQILLGYYDTFSNDAIVPEQYDIESIQSATSIVDFIQSPATDRPDSSNAFHDALIKFSADHGWNKTGISTTVNDLRQLVDGYLNFNGVKHKIGWVEGNWSDIHSNACMNSIKNSINSGRPVIVGAAGHAVVAYGYDNNYLYAHTGWGYIGKTPWSTVETGPFNINGHPFSIDVIEITSHLHSDNYHSTSNGNNTYLCPCGHAMHRVNVAPSSFGFVGDSANCYSGEDAVVNGLDIMGIRNNAGCKNNKLFMQARGKATSCLRFTLYQPKGQELRKAIFPLSAWSDTDYIANSECVIQVRYIEKDLSSTLLIDNILSNKDLPNNQANMQNYLFDIPNGKVGIEFDFALRNKDDSKMRTVAMGGFMLEYGGN